MSLKGKIEQEIKQAMLNRDKERLTPLRAIKSLILLAETEKGVAGEMTGEGEVKLLTKAAKQRKDSLEIFREQGRNDLADKEMSELKVIEEFLPKQLTESELTAELQGIIKEIGATSAKDMGKVMGAATSKLAGKADGRMIASIVKSLLS